MKLRNKITGQIGDLMGTERSCPYITIVLNFHDGNPRSFDYMSLAELNDEWEDYKPAEPLIKGEKIRKAVRAFSEAIQEKKHILVIKECGWGRAEFSNGADYWIRLPLDVETMDALEDRTYYSITELCGEDTDEA